MSNKKGVVGKMGRNIPNIPKNNDKVPIDIKKYFFITNYLLIFFEISSNIILVIVSKSNLYDKPQSFLATSSFIL